MLPVHRDVPDVSEVVTGCDFAHITRRAASAPERTTRRFCRIGQLGDRGRAKQPRQTVYVEQRLGISDMSEYSAFGGGGLPQVGSRPSGEALQRRLSALHPICSVGAKRDHKPLRLIPTGCFARKPTPQIPSTTPLEVACPDVPVSKRPDAETENESCEPGWTPRFPRQEVATSKTNMWPSTISDKLKNLA